ncbi:MarR family transcriptional regulator [uncultured Tateyamaria sp.]|uniref:MarR family winged helix-turn-helix transcriptional regulator n=1 Tax=uncultured Tateyamaria sp. TaxID=455651 RepID=UPI00263725AA|nr:MarR family transcriptional regulator [uncultured Tateyamaria sp.]
MTKAYGILLKELGVTYPQYAALMLLWEQDGILISDIAASLELDGGTATPLVQRLEKLDFVTRVRCDEDERRVRVFLTDQGKALFCKALEIPHGLGEATGLDGQTAHRIVDEMQDIKSNIADWLSQTQE